MSVGLDYLSSLLQCDNENFYRNLCPKQYLTPQELEIYNYIYENRVNYDLIPTFEDVHRNFGLLLPIVNGNPTLHLENLDNRFVQNNLREGYEKVAELLGEGHVKRAFSYLQNRLSRMHIVRNENSIFDFRNSGDILKRTTQENIANVVDRVQFGWPYLDDNFTNIYSEDVISIAARSGMGKTFLMLYIAYNTWIKYQQPVIFITLEMSYRKILQRLASLYINADVSKLDRANEHTLSDLSWMFAEMANLKNYTAPFYIIDGTLSINVSDVLALIKQLKAKICFVDGAYILDVENFTGDGHAKVAVVIKQLKSYARSERIPLVATWQLNREAAKIKNPKDVGLENLGLSDQIGNYSSLVLAILQENPLEEHTHRDVYVLKGREGQYGNFKINYVINDERVNFTQYVEPTYTMAEDGQMLIDETIEI